MPCEYRRACMHARWYLVCVVIVIQLSDNATLQNTSWCSCNGGIVTPTCSARVGTTAARVGSDLHCQSGNTAGRVGLHAAHCYWIACAGMHAAQCSDEHVSDKSCSTQLLREHVHDCMAASANGWLALAAARARNSDSS